MILFCLILIGLALILTAPGVAQTVGGYLCGGSGLDPVVPVNALTALAGGGQAGATLLSQQINRVTTVATRGDSVLLPAAAAGEWLIVINRGAQPMAVFPGTGDAINGQAANASILQLPNSIDLYACAVAGFWEVEPGDGFSGSLMCELAEDNITAFAGGGQASARVLTSQTSRITTVATSGDSIALPTSAPGLELMVINHGANPMQVFGQGSDQIDDQASATGVSQMPNSLVIYTCATAGKWYSEGLATGFGGAGLQTLSNSNALTAHAGGGQVSATALTSLVNRVATVATIGDSVQLPISVAGLVIVVNNAGANACDVFPQSADIINSLAPNAALRVAAGTIVAFYCTAAGQWYSTPTPLPAAQYTTNSAGTQTVAAGLLTGAAFTCAQNTANGALTWTTRTAAQMFGDLGNIQPGQSYMLRITNTGNGTLTLAAGSNVTLTGTMTVATNTTRDFVVTFNTATTVTIQSVGVGTIS